MDMTYCDFHSEPDDQTPQPLPPPRWATNSCVDEGGITHETVSPLRPTVTRCGPRGLELIPTDVVLAVNDVCINGQWIRTRPAIYVEGGAYTPDGAERLQTAVTTFVADLAAEGFDPATCP
jgi:hypothetical protein